MPAYRQLLSGHGCAVALACGLPDLSEAEAGVGAGLTADGLTETPAEKPTGEAESADESPQDPSDEPEAWADIDYDFDCIRIDRTERLLVVPPAGMRLRFRVLDCNGNPVPPLSADNFEIINDEKHEPFGQGLEGGGISNLAAPDDYGLFSVLAIDMSESIFQAGVVDDVVDGALKYLDAVEASNDGTMHHEIAIVAFGRPDAYEVVQAFSPDFDLLRAKVGSLRTGTSRGGTDLYGTYLEAIELVESEGQQFELVERFVVLFTDGTHEAGDEVEMRRRALEARSATDTNIYAVGIDGAYDPAKLEELASTQKNFVHVEDAEELERAFTQVGRRVHALARSNYVVGVCTPIALGDPTLTISISMQGSEGSAPQDQVTLGYRVDHLTGNTSVCDPTLMAESPLKCSGTVCEIACVEMQCGCDQEATCGQCDTASHCSDDNLCEPGSGDPGPAICLSDELPASGIAFDELIWSQAVGIPLAQSGRYVAPHPNVARLVRGRESVVRATWTLSEEWTARSVRAVLTLQQEDGERREHSDERRVDGLSDFSRHETSFNWRVAADQARPGVRFSVAIYESDGVAHGELGVGPTRIPEEGDIALDVPPDRMRISLTLVPIVHALGGCQKEPDMELATELFRNVMYATYPTNDLVITEHAPLTFTQELTRQGWGRLLHAVSSLKVSDNAAADNYYYGTVTPCGSTHGIGGMGYVPGENAGKVSAAQWRTSVGLVWDWALAHEVGHNVGRPHVPCSGAEASAVSDYPHPHGEIGVWGHHLIENTILSPQGHKDFMSYCSPRWVSDYGWNHTHAIMREVNSWATNQRDEVFDQQLRVLTGIVGAGGSSIWWLDEATFDPSTFPGTAARPLQFYRDGEMLGAAPAEYVRLSHDDGFAVRVIVSDGLLGASQVRYPVALDAATVAHATVAVDDIAGW